MDINQRNAQYLGRDAGKSYQEYQRKNNLPLDKASYEKEGLRQSSLETPFHKTRMLYIKGWDEMWREPEPPKVIPHNPNSRFCSCSKCMKE